jgi:hypothetical protein
LPSVTETLRFTTSTVEENVGSRVLPVSARAATAAAASAQKRRRAVFDARGVVHRLVGNRCVMSR